MDIFKKTEEEKRAEIREKLQSMKAAVDDIDRWILEASFLGNFSRDRVNDIYHRISIVQKHMVDLEKE